MTNTTTDPTLTKREVEDFREAVCEEIQQITLLSTAGDHAAVNATTNQIVFVAPRKCEITSIKLANTTAVTAQATNYFTIQVTNQTGDHNLFSSAFTTDSGTAAASNGSRTMAEDTLVNLHNNGTTEFLQNADLEAGDMLKLTLTDASGSMADLTYPVLEIRYRVVD